MGRCGARCGRAHASGQSAHNTHCGGPRTAPLRLREQIPRGSGARHRAGGARDGHPAHACVACAREGRRALRERGARARACGPTQAGNQAKCRKYWPFQQTARPSVGMVRPINGGGREHGGALGPFHDPGPASMTTPFPRVCDPTAISARRHATEACHRVRSCVMQGAVKCTSSVRLLMTLARAGARNKMHTCMTRACVYVCLTRVRCVFGTRLARTHSSTAARNTMHTCMTRAYVYVCLTRVFDTCACVFGMRLARTHSSTAGVTLSVRRYPAYSPPLPRRLRRLAR